VIEWDNADPDAGSVTFANNAFWSDMRSGTVIVIREDDPTTMRPTDSSIDPLGGDWWVEINVDDTPLVSNTGFKTDNDAWRARILDGSAVVQQDYVGEGELGWGGGGINGSEGGALTVTPTAVNPPLSAYDDVQNTSYGAPNAGQDFGALRAWVPEPSSFVLAAFAGCGVALGLVRRLRR
jgi:hypothetical protein